MLLAASVSMILAVVVATGCQSSLKVKTKVDSSFIETPDSDCLALASEADCPDTEETTEPLEEPVDDTTPTLSVFQPPASTGGELFVVAHQDDDLLFMNPDVLQSIQAGKQVRTVYLSSGEAGKGEAYWLSREKGVEAAYAQMAGVENTWETVPFVFAGKNIHLRNLVEAPIVSLMFLRLPDGMVYGNGTAGYANKTIEKLWKGSIADIPSSDMSQTFSRARHVQRGHHLAE